MGQREEAYVDQAELPKEPLLLFRRSLVELRLRVGARVEVVPAAVILENDEGDAAERYHHDHPLNAVRYGNGGQTSGPLECKNERKDTNDGVGRGHGEAEHAVERTLQRIHLRRDVDYAPHNLNGKDRVSQKLRSEAISDEVDRCAVIPHERRFAKPHSRAHEAVIDQRERRYPSESIETLFVNQMALCERNSKQHTRCKSSSPF